MSWGEVTWTPINADGTLGAAIPIVGVQQVSFDQGGSLIKGAGDLDPGPSTIVRDYSEPMAALKVDSVRALLTSGIQTGQIGVFSAVQADARNGVAPGGGALVHRLAPCVVDVGPTQGAYRKFADASATFAGYYPAGGGNPYSIAAA